MKQSALERLELNKKYLGHVIKIAAFEREFTGVVDDSRKFAGNDNLGTFEFHDLANGVIWFEHKEQDISMMIDVSFIQYLVFSWQEAVLGEDGKLTLVPVKRGVDNGNG